MTLLPARTHAAAATEEPEKPATSYDVGDLARRHANPFDDAAIRVANRHALDLVRVDSNVAYVLCPNCGFMEYKPSKVDPDVSWYMRISRFHAAYAALVEGVKP